MSRELAVENAVIEWAEANGFETRKMTYAGRHGCRDRDFYGYGHKLLVEFKRRDGKPRPHQDRERGRLANVGVTVHVIDNVDDGIALLERARANPVRGGL